MEESTGERGLEKVFCEGQSATNFRTGAVWSCFPPLDDIGVYLDYGSS